MRLGPSGARRTQVKEAQDYILANGVKADTDALGDILTDAPAKIKKLAVEPAVGTIKVAVTQDAKDNKTRGLHRQPEGTGRLQGSSGCRL